MPCRCVLLSRDCDARRSRTKFWFIKNYMSPQMKRFLPHMAQRCGFEYELVTYKWPTWLHKQARLLVCVRLS